MPNDAKAQFLQIIGQRFGRLHKLPRTQSLYDLGEGMARIYIRYSRIHTRGETFYGLRQEDLRLLDGRNSVICFLWDNQEEPLSIPYMDYQEVFGSTQPASDGQYKVMLFFRGGQAELYIAKAGRFNVDAHIGWKRFAEHVGKLEEKVPSDLSHSQVQSILAGIGQIKGYDLWIPPHDREGLDSSKVTLSNIRDVLPSTYATVEEVLREVDVVWIQRGASQIQALYEVEHSTPIYSALLRFNDVHLDYPTLRPQYVVVADQSRRALFTKQVSRPTFRYSGLDKECTFLEYGDAYRWYLKAALATRG
ncbi:MAG: hypothetical protein HYU30_11235 [Chloroflexi bacterium]|nr:hypothetical protein [Chloroflexota bacterium]